MPEFELRQSTDRKTWNLTGYASRTGVAYWVRAPGSEGGGWTETVAPGAFRSTLAAGADVVLNIHHQPPEVARTPKTLTLVEDSQGLKVSAELDAADPDVQGLVSKVTREILPEMSFAFSVPAKGDTWTRDDDTTQRTIHAVDLHKGDVSVVRSGANPVTSVSVRGQAAGAFEVRSSGLVVARQMDPTEPDDDDLEPCPVCGGAGTVDGYTCGRCKGTGVVSPDDEEEDGRAARGKYAAHELAKLGAKGQALAGPDGGWRYPVADRDDLVRAIKAVGRGKGDHDKIRKYIIGRAHALGLTALLPSNWTSSGALRSKRSCVLVGGPNDPEELRFRAEMIERGFAGRSGPPLLENDTADLRLEHEWRKRYRR